MPNIIRNHARAIIRVITWNRKLNVINITVVDVSAIIADSELRKRVAYNYRTDNLHNYKIPLPCHYYDMFINVFDLN